MFNCLLLSDSITNRGDAFFAVQRLINLLSIKGHNNYDSVIMQSKLHVHVHCNHVSTFINNWAALLPSMPVHEEKYNRAYVNYMISQFIP